MEKKSRPPDGRGTWQVVYTSNLNCYWHIASPRQHLMDNVIESVY